MEIVRELEAIIVLMMFKMFTLPVTYPHFEWQTWILNQPVSSNKSTIPKIKLFINYLLIIKTKMSFLSKVKPIISRLLKSISRYVDLVNILLLSFQNLCKVKLKKFWIPLLFIYGIIWRKPSPLDFSFHFQEVKIVQ